VANYKPKEIVVIKALKKVADIRSGFLPRSNMDGTKQIYLIQLKDMDDNGCLDYDNLKSVSIDEGIAVPYLKEGDVVFKAKSHKRFASCIKNNHPKNITATSHFLIVQKISDAVLPEFVAWYLNQKNAQDFLAMHANGTAIPIITVKALGNLPITIPALQKQKEIVEIYKLFNREKELMMQLVNKKEKLLQKVLLDQAGGKHV
jgi:restriction endonuclease S subunit